MLESNFFTNYSTLNAGTEVVKSFAKWCSISAIAASLGRRVWIDMGPFTIYPNLYVILVAGSGRQKKSTAGGVVKSLYRAQEVQPNWVSERVTREKLFDELRMISADKIKMTNAVLGQGYAIIDELTTFLDKRAAEGGVVELLIQLYDCDKEIKQGTMARGTEKLFDTQLNLLAATTPESLRKALPENTIGSGLASRLIFIYDETIPEPQFWPQYTDEQIKAREFCIRAIARYQQISGPITMSAECKSWLKDCYENRCHKSPFYDDPFLRGYASRRYIHILKLAISISVGLTESTNITTTALEAAEGLLVANEKNLIKIIQLVTTNEKGAMIQYVHSIIQKHKKIDSHDLLRLVSHRLDSNELGQVLETLKKSHQIDIIANGTHIFYIIKD